MKHILVRTRLMVPISDTLGRTKRIKDSYILTEGNLIKEVGKFNPEHIDKILDKFKGSIEIIGAKGRKISQSSKVPQINGVALPGFVKGHGHDHESPLIGVAKDVPLTTWLDEAVNHFTGFLHDFLLEDPK